MEIDTVVDNSVVATTVEENTIIDSVNGKLENAKMIDKRMCKRHGREFKTKEQRLGERQRRIEAKQKRTQERLERKNKRALSNGNQRCHYKKSDSEAYLKKKAYVDSAADANFLELDTRESWPTGVTHLFLDGNNMLYLNGAFRSYTITRKSHVVEQCFARLAEASATIIRVPNTVLTFDHAVNSDFSKQLEENIQISISSAKKQGFASTDEAFVTFARNNPEIAKTSLFVTSDRELIGRLKELGVTNFTKPGRWLKFVVVAMLGGNEQEWLVNLLKTISSETCA